MWTKIYLGALTIAVLPLLFLYFYAKSWLGSIDAPAVALSNYDYFSGLAWNYLWFAVVILLVLANVVFWKTRKAWVLWTTFAFFAVFVVAKYFWLDVSRNDFKLLKGLGDDGFSGGVFIGTLYVVLFAAIVFFNQFIVLRLNEKMYPSSAPVSDLPELPAEEIENSETQGE